MCPSSGDSPHKEWFGGWDRVKKSRHFPHKRRIIPTIHDLRYGSGILIVKQSIRYDYLVIRAEDNLEIDGLTL
jgi:hypothetical protein